MTDGISILIPTHNRGAILDRTLDSLRHVRLPAGLECEIVVVANACTDDTTTRVGAKSLDMPIPTRCFVEPIAGLGSARNAAVRAARFPICALLDDDVWVEPGWLESLLDVYSRTPADMIAGRARLWWEAVDRPAWLTPLMEMALSGLDRGHKPYEMSVPDAVGANFSFRRSVFDHVGPFRTDLDRIGRHLLGGGETYFVREAMKRGHRLYYSPDVSVRHWVAPHRIGAEYLAGVTRGSSYVNVIMKERYDPIAAARSIGLGLARAIGFWPVQAWATFTRQPGLRVHACTRRAAGIGQFTGAIARLRNGPLKPQENKQAPGRG